MIDKKTSKTLIKAIGKNHLSKLLEFAQPYEFSKNYSSEQSRRTVISYVLHGKRESPEIEQMILDCAKFCQKERESQKRKLKKFAERIKKTA